MITAEQKQARKNGVGASDTPIIMGFSNYKTPYQLYRDKLGLDDIEQKETEQQYWGNRLESIIVEEYSKKNDVRVIYSPPMVHKLDKPYMFANLDALIPTENAVLEVKTVDKFQKHLWGTEGTDIIPMAYLVQVAHQCIVTNAEYGVIACLIGGNEYKEYRYNRDSELEAMICEAVDNFWFNHVLKKIDPASITIDDSRLKYGNVNPDTIIVANDDIIIPIQTINDAKRIKKEQDKIEEDAKMKVFEFMQNNETLVDQTGKTLVSLKKNVKGSRVFLLK